MQFRRLRAASLKRPPGFPTPSGSTRWTRTNSLSSTQGSVGPGTDTGFRSSPESTSQRVSPAKTAYARSKVKVRSKGGAATPIPPRLLHSLSPSSLYRSFSVPDNLSGFPSGFFSSSALPPDFYQAPYYTQHRSLPLVDDSNPDTTQAWGYILLFSTFMFFVVGMYTTVVAKLLPATGNRILDAIRTDHYYCYLVPLTLTVAFYTVIWNWLGMKIFRHN
ncbi:hypothetical protein IWQ61_007227 [Dispira simplex]|nr:hypothetical protein IWQ61_007227 [Dispira simplex]